MVRMEKVIRGDILLDVCKICGGTWFDKNEIEKLFLHMKNQETAKNDVLSQKQAPVKNAAKKTAPKTK
jgi:Zn-finger nucleic acid-binding protein